MVELFILITLVVIALLMALVGDFLVHIRGELRKINECLPNVARITRGDKE